MFGLGIWELIVVLAVALIVLGPRQLPTLARQLGRALREFRRAADELKYGLDDIESRSTHDIASPSSSISEGVGIRSPDASGESQSQPASDSLVRSSGNVKSRPSLTSDETTSGSPDDALPSEAESRDRQSAPAEVVRTPGLPKSGGHKR